MKPDRMRLIKKLVGLGLTVSLMVSSLTGCMSSAFPLPELPAPFDQLTSLLKRSANSSAESSEDPALINFNADTVHIPVGEATDVLFTVEAKSPFQIASRNLAVYEYGSEESLGKLHDDGKDGDEKAHDNIYSCRISLTQPEWKTLDYCASDNKSTSNTVEISFYKNLTDADYQNLHTINAIVQDFENSHAQEVTSKESIQQLYQTLSASEHVQDIYLNEETSTITVKTDAGLTCVWSPESADTKGGFSDIFGDFWNQLFSSFSKESSSADTSWFNDELSADYGTASIYENANILIIGPYYSEDSRFARVNYRYAADSLAERLNGTVTVWQDEAVTLSAMTRLKDFDIILFDTHGTYADEINQTTGKVNGDPFIILNECLDTSTSSNNISYLASEIIVNMPSGRIGIGARFFRNNYQAHDFDDALFHIGSCYSMKNASIANALTSKGAEWVDGYKYPVSFSADDRYLVTLTDNLIDNSTTGECKEEFFNTSEYKQQVGSVGEKADIYQGYGDSNFSVLEPIPKSDQGKIKLIVKDAETNEKITSFSAVVSAMDGKELNKVTFENETNCILTEFKAGHCSVAIQSQEYEPYIETDVPTRPGETYELTCILSKGPGAAWVRFQNCMYDYDVDGMLDCINPVKAKVIKIAIRGLGAMFNFSKDDYAAIIDYLKQYQPELWEESQSQRVNWIVIDTTIDGDTAVLTLQQEGTGSVDQVPCVRIDGRWYLDIP